MQILDSLAPVFLLIALGSILVRSGFIKREMLKGMNDLAYWIGLPSFIFYSLATVSLDTSALLPTLLTFLAGTVTAIVGGWIAVHLLRQPRVSRGTFIQASFRGNLAFIGLPIVVFSVSGLPNEEAARIRELAVLSLGPIMVIYNVVAVFVLYASHSGDGWKMFVKALRQLVTNPLILASLAGIGWALADFPFPTFLYRSCEALGRLALPLALLAIGGSLVTVPVRGSLMAAGTASLLKIGVAPLAGVALGIVFGVPSEGILVAGIYLACPTAAASYVLARQLGGDEALAASTIVISTLLSLISLSLAIALL